MRTIVLLLAVAAVGCGSSDTCSQNPASCQDAGDGTCTGQCAPAGVGYNVLLWSGPAGTTPPACPEAATPGVTERGFLDTQPSGVTCSPACSCSPSGNQCLPPSTMTASTAACPASGGASFDAPSVWDGMCSVMDPVGSAKSLTVDPPTLPFNGVCAPSMPNVVDMGTGPTIAITCQAIAPNVPGVCLGADEYCTYPNVPGFSVCTTVAIGYPCPEGWPVQHTFFQASCGCTCGMPTGEVCSTTVMAYEDGACSKEVGAVTLTSDDAPTCVNIFPEPSPLGSKSASVTYMPGTCAPTLTQIASETLCCLK